MNCTSNAHKAATSRRGFLQAALGAGAIGLSARSDAADATSASGEHSDATDEQLARAAAEPILRIDALKSPARIESMELLRNGETFLVRVRSTDGAEGLAVPNADRLIDMYPVFVNRVAPFFPGKDARELEPLLEELYRHDSNYKLQGVALWSCVAAAEFAILDLLGKLTDQSIGELLGGVRRRDIAVYRASGKRGNRPEEEIAYLQELVAETGAKAIKFRLGGRMSNNADSLPGRSERLIPLVRETFGNEMTLYADSNSSYDVPKAIEIGRVMEQYRYAFFEEPCRFDDLWATKAVADALEIPVAGGEQEFSMRRFLWAIANRGVDVVQPDLHYFGGFLRCLRVSHMAEVAGMPCTVHMSGSGLGFLDVLHFASCAADPGPFQEFKGASDIPFHCETSSLRCENGVMRVPSGPGFGVTIDPDFVKQAKAVTAS